MSQNLTRGALARIYQLEDVVEPLLQVLGYKAMKQGGGQERYRLMLSDGEYYNTLCMLASQHNHRIAHNKELEMFTVIRVQDHHLSCFCSTCCSSPSVR